MFSAYIFESVNMLVFMCLLFCILGKKKKKKKRRYWNFHFNIVFIKKRIKIRKLETILIENLTFCHFLTVYVIDKVYWFRDVLFI